MGLGMFTENLVLNRLQVLTPVLLVLLSVVEERKKINSLLLQET